MFYIEKLYDYFQPTVQSNYLVPTGILSNDHVQYKMSQRSVYGDKERLTEYYFVGKNKNISFSKQNLYLVHAVTHLYKNNVVVDKLSQTFGKGILLAFGNVRTDEFIHPSIQALEYIEDLLDTVRINNYKTNELITLTKGLICRLITSIRESSIISRSGWDTDYTQIEEYGADTLIEAMEKIEELVNITNGIGIGYDESFIVDKMLNYIQGMSSRYNCQKQKYVFSRGSLYNKAIEPNFPKGTTVTIQMEIMCDIISTIMYNTGYTDISDMMHSYYRSSKDVVNHSNLLGDKVIHTCILDPYDTRDLIFAGKLDYAEERAITKLRSIIDEANLIIDYPSATDSIASRVLYDFVSDCECNTNYYQSKTNAHPDLFTKFVDFIQQVDTVGCDEAGILWVATPVPNGDLEFSCSIDAWCTKDNTNMNKAVLTVISEMGYHSEIEKIIRRYIPVKNKLELEFILLPDTQIMRIEMDYTKTAVFVRNRLLSTIKHVLDTHVVRHYHGRCSIEEL